MVPTTATTSHSLSFLTIKTNTCVNLDLTLSPNTRCEMCITNFRCQPKSLGIIPDCNPTCQVWEQTVAWLSGASEQEWIITNNKIFVMAIFVCWLPYRKKTLFENRPLPWVTKIEQSWNFLFSVFHYNIIIWACHAIRMTWLEYIVVGCIHKILSGIMRDHLTYHSLIVYPND